MARTQSDVTGWVGWVYFAGIVMVMMGVFHFIAGLVALFTNTVYVAGESAVWVLDYTTWGWIHLLAGLAVFFAGLAVMSGATWGRVIAVMLTLLSAIINFAFIPIYPVWSIVILVIDALVLYALIAHGREAAEQV